MPRINLTATRIEMTPEATYRMTREELEAKLTGRQEYVGFAVPEGTVTFLTMDGRLKQHNPTANYKFGGPRLIVAERRLRRIVFTETGDVRPMNRDEYGIDNEGRVFQADTHVTEPFAIVTREVQEVQ